MIKFATASGILLLSLALILGAGQSFAAEKAEASGMAQHKLVLQISDDDPRTQTRVLNVANNMRKAFGHSNIDIEIVAFGPGLKLLFDKNENKNRVDALAMGGVHFTACSNTIAGMTKKMGKAPVLYEDAISLKKPGVARIIELVEEGYLLVRP